MKFDSQTVIYSFIIFNCMYLVVWTQTRARNQFKGLSVLEAPNNWVVPVRSMVKARIIKRPDRFSNGTVIFPPNTTVIKHSIERNLTTLESSPIHVMNNKNILASKIPVQRPAVIMNAINSVVTKTHMEALKKTDHVKDENPPKNQGHSYDSFASFLRFNRLGLALAGRRRLSKPINYRKYNPSKSIYLNFKRGGGFNDSDNSISVENAPLVEQRPTRTFKGDGSLNSPQHDLDDIGHAEAKVELYPLKQNLFEYYQNYYTNRNNGPESQEEDLIKGGGSSSSQSDQREFVRKSEQSLDKKLRHTNSNNVPKFQKEDLIKGGGSSSSQSDRRDFVRKSEQSQDQKSRQPLRENPRSQNDRKDRAKSRVPPPPTRSNINKNVFETAAQGKRISSSNKDTISDNRNRPDDRKHSNTLNGVFDAYGEFVEPLRSHDNKDGGRVRGSGGFRDLNPSPEGGSIGYDNTPRRFPQTPKVKSDIRNNNNNNNGQSFRSNNNNNNGQKRKTEGDYNSDRTKDIERSNVKSPQPSFKQSPPINNEIPGKKRYNNNGWSPKGSTPPTKTLNIKIVDVEESTTSSTTTSTTDATTPFLFFSGKHGRHLGGSKKSWGSHGSAALTQQDPKCPWWLAECRAVNFLKNTDNQASFPKKSLGTVTNYGSLEHLPSKILPQADLSPQGNPIRDTEYMIRAEYEAKQPTDTRQTYQIQVSARQEPTILISASDRPDVQQYGGHSFGSYGPSVYPSYSAPSSLPPSHIPYIQSPGLAPYQKPFVRGSFYRPPSDLSQIRGSDPSAIQNIVPNTWEIRSNNPLESYGTAHRLENTPNDVIRAPIIDTMSNAILPEKAIRPTIYTTLNPSFPTSGVSLFQAKPDSVYYQISSPIPIVHVIKAINNITYEEQTVKGIISVISENTQKRVRVKSFQANCNEENFDIWIIFTGGFFTGKVLLDDPNCSEEIIKQQEVKITFPIHYCGTAGYRNAVNPKRMKVVSNIHLQPMDGAKSTYLVNCQFFNKANSTVSRP